MPYTTELIDDGRGLLHVGTRVLTGAEILAGARAAHTISGRAGKFTHGLTDLTGVTELKLTADEVRRISDEHRITARLTVQGAPVALIVSSDVVFGMVRMWQAHVDDTGWTIRLFRSRAEAEAWLSGQLAGGG
jgi:hypothetical protein